MLFLCQDRRIDLLLSLFFSVLGFSLGERSCALLFFGIGRKFKDVAFPSIKVNIIDANPECDVFIHTYNVSKAFGNRIGEDGSGDVDVNEIFLLTNRSSIIIETEEDFQRQRNVTYYRSLFPMPSRWDYPSSMDNMIRQWHSIETVWTAMERHEEALSARYISVGLFRLDVLYTNPIVVGDAKTAVIPRLMYRTSQNKQAWGGYNDRLFYGKRDYAKSWATERFNSVQPYLQWQKSNTQYVTKAGLHSEDFMRWMLVIQFPVPLLIKPICFKRIRSSGMIMNDCALLAESKKDPEAFSSVKNGIDGSNLMSGLPGKSHAAYQICTIVRTHVGHANLLPITLLSLTQQSYTGLDVNLSIFVINTDPQGYMESGFMHSAAAYTNSKAGLDLVTVLDESFHKKPPSKKAYGYDVTDLVLEHLLVSECNCTHFLFTNGDNFYSRSLVEWIQPSISDGKQLIAWDFLSHHKRKYNVIQVQFIRQHVDLGSVLVDRRAIEVNPHVKFLPQGGRTVDLFARDFFFFKEIYDRVGPQNISVIHQVLFAHQ
ncbi:hypothetical protein ACHAXR_012764 [Thalassiosira sp. AJA248-18]